MQLYGLTKVFQSTLTLHQIQVISNELIDINLYVLSILSETHLRNESQIKFIKFMSSLSSKD